MWDHQAVVEGSEAKMMARDEKGVYLRIESADKKRDGWYLLIRNVTDGTC